VSFAFPVDGASYRRKHSEIGLEGHLFEKILTGSGAPRRFGVASPPPVLL
jgi:hypothetical protein